VNDSPSRHNVRGCSSADSLEARGLPRIYRSPLPLGRFLLCKGGRGGWRRWREAALRPVSPYRASSCQSRVVSGLGWVELRSILTAGQRSSTFTPTYRFFSFFIVVSKLNTTTRYITTTTTTTSLASCQPTLPHFPSVPSLLPYFLGIHPLTSAPRIVTLHSLHSLLLL